MISNIPLSKFNREDRLIWSPTKKGSFIVKSAYKLAIEKLSINGGDGSNVSKDKCIWKSIWNLPVTQEG